MSLDRVFAAKGAGVSGVLADFHLLDLFAEGGAVSVFEAGDVSLVSRVVRRMGDGSDIGGELGGER